MIFDTHAHYDDEQFDIDREELLAEVRKSGIGQIVNVGAGLETSKRALELSDTHDYIYAAVGVHPSEVEELNEDSIGQIEEMCHHKKCVAIGEIGLDYHWPEPSKELQQFWFRRQLDIARKNNLPVIIHSRDAAKDTVDIMKEEHAEEIGGVVHCFSYSKEIADICLKMGFYIGVGGVLTFKNAKKLVEVVENTPLERILLETDCPYLAPEPNRGKRNSSLNLPYVVTAMSRIKGVNEEEIIKVTEANAKRMYRL